uniref:CCHC-type domain-containing protein n=1 Tax=Romanomermis culicivorax TaxID=13658 RepID=A0A915JV35_ROMCU
MNIMQAAESAESLSTTIRGSLNDVYAIRNNSCCNSNRYLNRGRDQSLNQSKLPQSPRRSKHCRGCGLTHHTYLSPNCKAKNSKCYDCGSTGNFAKYCQ